MPISEHDQKHVDAFYSAIEPLKDAYRDDSFGDPQHKVAFDLCCFATAFACLHEFRHVMLDRDGARPSDIREPNQERSIQVTGLGRKSPQRCGDRGSTR